MNRLFAALLLAPLLISVIPEAHAGTVTRVVTTTTSNQCRDFTKTTNYVNKTVSRSGTACLFEDGAWHDVTTPGQPIVEYGEEPVIVQRPVVYREPEIIPVPVYYGGYGYYDHPHHYDGGYYRGNGYGRGGGYSRGGVSYDINFRGRL